MSLGQITDDLVAELDGLTFAPPVTHVYNPLVYARNAWDLYCEKYGQGRREVLMIGMNPGPFGMSQCGVPFGEIAHVRDWLNINVPIGKPPVEHPKRASKQSNHRRCCYKHYHNPSGHLTDVPRMAVGDIGMAEI